MKVLLFLIFFIQQAQAFDNPYLMRSPRGMLMGDAFTAFNDDDFTLFYNPASLGRHKNDLTLYPFNPQLNGTNIINDLDRFEDFPDEPVAASDVLMNYPVHASAGISPGFKLFNFGVTFMANQSYDVLLRNPSHPMLDLDIRSDRGILMGLAIPLGPSRINRKSQSGTQTSFGIGAKYIERTGVRDTLALTGPIFLETIDQSEFDKILQSLGKVKGIGFGFDAGLEHVHREGNSQIIVGLAALDITGTDFTEAHNPNRLQVADNRDQVNFGMAAGQDYKIFHYVLSVDVRGLNEQMDFGKRLRFGAQVGIPGLTFMGGVNSGYYSYGATLDLNFVKFTMGLYDVEIGSKYKQIKSQRFVIYMSLFDFSFDA